MSFPSQVALGSLGILLGLLLVRAPADETAKAPENEPPFIQLNYEAWKQIEVGMTEEDVVALIGPPYYKSTLY